MAEIEKISLKESEAIIISALEKDEEVVEGYDSATKRLVALGEEFAIKKVVIIPNNPTHYIIGKVLSNTRSSKTHKEFFHF